MARRPIVAFAAMFLPAVAWAQPAPPDVPKEIAVPAGHKVLLRAEAKGVQIYKAVAGKSGGFEWVLEAHWRTCLTRTALGWDIIMTTRQPGRPRTAAKL